MSLCSWDHEHLPDGTMKWDHELPDGTINWDHEHLPDGTIKWDHELPVGTINWEHEHLPDGTIRGPNGVSPLHLHC